MQTIGIVGGIGPESTVEYYRRLVSSYRQRSGANDFPSIVINSIDMTRMLDLIGTGEYDTVAQYLASEADRLLAAGATFGALASNTPHVVFDRVQALTALPLLSIVDAVAQAASQQVGRVALFGTRFTMQGGFYDAVLGAAGVEVVVPNRAEQDFIHDRYMGELVNGIVRDETRAGLVRVAMEMRERDGVAGLVLGGTELSLILGDEDLPQLCVLDSTAIHVERLLDEFMGSPAQAPGAGTPPG